MKFSFFTAEKSLCILHIFGMAVKNYIISGLKKMIQIMFSTRPQKNVHPLLYKSRVYVGIRFMFLAG